MEHLKVLILHVGLLLDIEVLLCHGVFAFAFGFGVLGGEGHGHGMGWD